MESLVLKEELQALWNPVLNYIRDVEKISKSAYDAFVKDVKPSEVTEKEFIVLVSNIFQKNFWEEHLKNAIVYTFYEKTGKGIEPKFVLEEKEEIAPVEEVKNFSGDRPLLSSEYQQKDYLEEISLVELNENYTFDNFVVGGSNRFAVNVSLAVAEGPGKTYNPLFLYGGTGLGKTHLMQAIGHEMKRKNPRAKMKYVTAEDFMNGFVQSLRLGQAELFQEEYRNLDLLMVDDIQFFNNVKGAEGTRESFFNTFNTLHGNGKQVVLISDRLPQDLQNLEERLISRFQWGISQEILPPDFETRFAILKNKANYYRIDIPDEALRYIAGQFSGNVRELEGALNRVIFYSTMESEDITVELTAIALEGLKKSYKRAKATTIEKIQKSVCEYYKITLSQMKGKNRSKQLVIPRQIAMFLSKEMTGSSYPKIAAEFGGKDHSTVMHAVRKIKKNIGSDDDFRKEVEMIQNKL